LLDSSKRRPRPPAQSDRPRARTRVIAMPRKESQVRDHRAMHRRHGDRAGRVQVRTWVRSRLHGELKFAVLVSEIRVEGLIRRANEATASAVRGELRCCHRRLRRGYSRFGRAHPGRAQIGSGCSPGQGDSLEQPERPEVSHSRRRARPPDQNNESKQTAGEIGASASRSPSRAGTTLSCLHLGPAFDFRTQPELHPSIAEVDDRTRHVVVPALVEANAVAMRQPEDVGDHLSVDEVLGADARTHQIKATSVDGSVRRGR